MIIEGRILDLWFDNPRKKQRGQRGKLKSLVENINSFNTDYNCDGLYQCFRVPCRLSFLHSRKTGGYVKSQFARTWLRKTQEFIDNKPQDRFIKVVASLDMNNLWFSQINIFYDEEYYEEFFLRNTHPEDYIRITYKNLNKQRNLKTTLTQLGVKENYSYEDEGELIKATNEYWHYGELPSFVFID